MRRIVLIFIIIATFMLGACSSQVPQKATPPATPPPATPSPSLPPASTSSAELASAGCTVQSPFPTPGPTEQSLFPPAGENDWVSGPDSAAMTLLEYSDFQ